jgi:hypothetical protein
MAQVLQITQINPPCLLPHLLPAQMPQLSSMVAQPLEGDSLKETSQDIIFNQSVVMTDSEPASPITADNVVKDTTGELEEISSGNIHRIQNDDEENGVNSKKDSDLDSEEGDEEVRRNF